MMAPLKKKCEKFNEIKNGEEIKEGDARETGWDGSPTSHLQKNQHNRAFSNEHIYLYFLNFVIYL